MSAWMAIGAIAISGTVAVGVGVVGEAAVNAAAARSAADAAALAGAADGPETAARAAELNGARLISIDTIGMTTHVVVTVDGVEVEAAAERLAIPVP